MEALNVAVGQSLYNSLINGGILGALVKKDILSKEEARELLDRVMLSLENMRGYPGGIVEAVDYARDSVKKMYNQIDNI